MALRLDDFFDENDDARKKEQREKVEIREDNAGSAELTDEDDFEDRIVGGCRAGCVRRAEVAVLFSCGE